MQRRNFLKQGGTLMALASLSKMNGPLPLSRPAFNDEAVVHLALGSARCTLFRDFQFTYQPKDFFINAEGADVERELKRFTVGPAGIPSPFVALLVQEEDRKVLIDTGIGFAKNPVVVRGREQKLNGRLPELLQGEGIKGEDITDVILTHFHPDHIGSIYSEEHRLLYPNARFHVPEEEWDFWHSARSAAQPELFQNFIQRQVTPLKEGNLHRISGDFVPLVGGITAVKAEGHTPGQIALVIQSGGEKLLYISDAFLHPLHIERLDWQTNYDGDHRQARRSREKLLALAHSQNMLVQAFHFHFPGLGRIEKKSNGWKWAYQKP